jgi:hypothetical protein
MQTHVFLQGTIEAVLEIVLLGGAPDWETLYWKKLILIFVKFCPTYGVSAGECEAFTLFQS